MTDAMVAGERRLDWHEKLIVDEHSIGGIPSNRTSMLIGPIGATHGLLFPKTSLRAITSPPRTAHTLEMLAKVELPSEQLEDIVRQNRACLAAPPISCR